MAYNFFIYSEVLYGSLFGFDQTKRLSRQVEKKSTVLKFVIRKNDWIGLHFFYQRRTTFRIYQPFNTEKEIGTTWVLERDFMKDSIMADKKINE